MTSEGLYPSDALRFINGFNPEVKRGQEHELNLRLYLSGIDFIYIPGICYSYREHDSQYRISNANRHDYFYSDIANVSRLIDVAEMGPRLAELGNISNVLAAHLWRLGRGKARVGQIADAQTYFEAALKMGGDRAISGSSAYRYIVKVANPFFAERIGGLLNRLNISNMGRR